MNVNELKSDVYFHTGCTSATYPNADLIRNINIAYEDVNRIIWSSMDGWQYDDSNATGLPIGYTNLTASTQEYTLPTTCQRVQRVEVKDSNGNFVKLKAIDSNDVNMALPEYYKTDGLPMFYDLVGKYILLYPAPGTGYTTMSSGLAVYFDRNVTLFPVTASTTTPGFASNFHRILSYAAAIDFEQDEGNRNNLLRLKANLEQGLINFYSKRNIERGTAIRPARRKGWLKYT